MPHYSRNGDELRAKKFLAQFSEFEAGVSDFVWYRSLFQHSDDRKSGDISPSYAKLSPSRIESASNNLKGCRFIFLLREPVSRVWSELCMHVRRNQIDAEQLLNWETLAPLLSDKNVQLNSHASVAWEKWTKHVPAERIRFWFFDDIVSRPTEVIDEICSFVGIDRGLGGLPPDFNRKHGNPKVPMADKIREMLSKEFSEEYERCASLFGGHALAWRDAARQTKAF